MKKQSVLDQYIKVAELLFQRRLQLWPQDTQQQILSFAMQATRAIEKDVIDIPRLERPVSLLKQIRQVKKTLEKTTDNEVEFLKALCDFIDVYKKNRIYAEANDRMDQIEIFITNTKREAVEYFFYVSLLQDQKKGMSEKTQREQDLKTIQEVGIFFILEYSLQVLFEFTQQSDQDKYKLLHHGLHTEAGSLPPYIPAEEGMRETLCYKIFDDQLRKKLLNAYFDLEQSFIIKDLKVIFKALKQYNITMLTLFRQKGLRQFEGKIYAPFGNNVPVEQIIGEVEKIDAA